MPVPGYDPEDIDDTLETYIDEGEIEDLLTTAERQSYRSGDASLVDLLSGTEVAQLLEETDVSVEMADDPDQ